jgi:hypothetical protein
MAPIRWRSVAWMSASVAVLAGACIWAPVYAHQRQLREQSRLAHLAAARELDATGFWICRDPMADERPPGNPVDFLADPEGRVTLAAVTPDLEVWAFPTWYSPWRVTLTGSRLEVAESRGRSFRPPPPPEPGKPPIAAPTVRLLSATVDIDPARARRIREQFERTLAQASDEMRLGSDGMTFKIRMHGRCYQTWSPDQASGAGRLTAVAQLLALHGSRGERVDAGRSLRAIDILLDSFEHGDGSGLIGRAKSESEFEAWIPWTPEWTGEPPSPRVP